MPEGLFRVIDLRKRMILEDLRIPTTVTYSRLWREGIEPWDGLLFGMRCVPSPIILAER
jgi:hypothetical protein